tara:strand:- start:844 stop:2112 length:1269 start_codon:yes stop_codon:yes gene_type:complete
VDSKKHGRKFNAHDVLQKMNLKDYLHVPDVGTFHFNQSGYWEEIKRSYVEMEIKKIIGDPTRYEIAEVSRMFELDTLIPRYKELNQHRGILNLKNGLMDIRTGEVKPHRRDFLSSIQLPITFNPQSECPRWEKFLSEVVDFPELVAVLQEFAGLCLIQESKFHKCLVLVGAGANGKSTFLTVLENLLGKQNISSVPMGKLESEFHRASLYNKLVNISSELEINELMGSGYFKSIVSGDTIDAAFKFQNSFSFKPTARLIFAMNELPRSKDRSYGYYRRFLIVPFNKEFKGEKADRTLSKKLIDEMDGIFNWALAGLKRLFEKDDFTQSKVLDEMVEQYKRDNNPVITFIEENCFVNPGATISKNKLFKAYTDFCKSNGYYSLNVRHFYKELKKQISGISESYPRIESGRERILHGVSLEDSE